MIAAAAEYVIQHGVAGRLGRFRASSGPVMNRGDSVVIRGRRGLEIGTVLCRAGSTPLDADGFVGEIVRVASGADAQLQQDNQEFGQTVFESARRMAADSGLALILVDIEVAFDRKSALLHAILAQQCETELLLAEVGETYGLIVRLHELNEPVAEDEHGCGSCGSGGGCGSCGAGGCSSCSSGTAAELQEYFSELRSQMENRNRLTLL